MTMRVLQIIDTLRFGGAQRLLLTFGEEAHRCGLDISVACLDVSKGTPLAPAFEALGIPVATFPARRLLDYSRLANLIRFMREGKYSLVHAHLTSANILGGLAGWWAGIPVVSTLHSTALDRRHSHFIRDRLELLLLRRATRVIAVGKSVADAYRVRLDREFAVVPNAASEGVILSVEQRNALRQSLTGYPKRKILLSVGRLSPDKCFDDMLEAFALVHDRAPDVALVIVGDGDLRDELIVRTTELGLTDHVFWLGMRDDVPQLLAASDIYVSSSKREGLSLALLEAMMAGLPLVVTAVGEVPHMLDVDSGVLVQPQQPGILADAILALLSDSHRQARLGAAARMRAKENYGVEAWFDRLVNLYKEVAR